MEIMWGHCGVTGDTYNPDMTTGLNGGHLGVIVGSQVILITPT